MNNFVRIAGLVLNNKVEADSYIENGILAPEDCRVFKLAIYPSVELEISEDFPTDTAMIFCIEGVDGSSYEDLVDAYVVPVIVTDRETVYIADVEDFLGNQPNYWYGSEKGELLEKIARDMCSVSTKYVVEF